MRLKFRLWRFQCEIDSKSEVVYHCPAGPWGPSEILMTAISERNCEKFLCKSVRRRSEPDRLIALHWPLATVWQLRIRRAKGTEHWVAEKLTLCKSMLGAEWKGKWLSTDTPHDRGSSSSICWPPASAKNRNTKIPSVESDIGLWNKSIKSNQIKDRMAWNIEPESRTEMEIARLNDDHWIGISKER